MISGAIKLASECLIKPFEGYAKRLPDGSCQAYPDPATKGSPWTIGYGSTGPEITQHTVWTHERAELELAKHLQFFASSLLTLSPILATVEDRRFAALISFAYNCGLGNYRISTLRKRVDEQDWDAAADELLKWNKAKGRVLAGLTRRRQAEASFLR